LSGQEKKSKIIGISETVGGAPAQAKEGDKAQMRRDGMSQCKKSPRKGCLENGGACASGKTCVKARQKAETEGDSYSTTSLRGEKRSGD